MSWSAFPSPAHLSLCWHPFDFHRFPLWHNNACLPPPHHSRRACAVNPLFTPLSQAKSSHQSPCLPVMSLSPATPSQLLAHGSTSLLTPATSRFRGIRQRVYGLGSLAPPPLDRGTPYTLFTSIFQCFVCACHVSFWRHMASCLPSWHRHPKAFLCYLALICLCSRLLCLFSLFAPATFCS